MTSMQFFYSFALCNWSFSSVCTLDVLLAQLHYCASSRPGDFILTACFQFDQLRERKYNKKNEVKNKSKKKEKRDETKKREEEEIPRKREEKNIKRSVRKKKENRENRERE